MAALYNHPPVYDQAHHQYTNLRVLNFSPLTFLGSLAILNGRHQLFSSLVSFPFYVELVLCYPAPFQVLNVYRAPLKNVFDLHRALFTLFGISQLYEASTTKLGYLFSLPKMFPSSGALGALRKAFGACSWNDIRL